MDGGSEMWKRVTVERNCGLKIKIARGVGLPGRVLLSAYCQRSLLDQRRRFCITYHSLTSGCRAVAMLADLLLVAESDHWVDARSAAGWPVGRRQRDRYKKRAHSAKRQRIAGAHAEQQQ